MTIRELMQKLSITTEESPYLDCQILTHDALGDSFMYFKIDDAISDGLNKVTLLLGDEVDLPNG